jgi:hypothetical protein
MKTEYIVCSCIARRLPKEIAKVNGGTVPTAITIGGKTFFFVDPGGAPLHRHEAVHREQQARLGWRFYPAYLWEHWRRGYAGNRFEVEARKAEDL